MQQYSKYDKVRILDVKGMVPEELYYVENDDGSGKITVLPESSVTRDDEGNIVSSKKKVVVNAHRVFPPEVQDHAPVIQRDDEQVAFCPKCGSRHTVTIEDTAITCATHGEVQLYRTGRTMPTETKSKVPAKPKAEKPARVPKVKAPKTESDGKGPPFDVDAVKAVGELWVKDRVGFDHPGFDVKAYVLIVQVAPETYRKHCINTYNGGLGKKAKPLDLDRLKSADAGYAVAKVDVERTKLTNQDYKQLS